METRQFGRTGHMSSVAIFGAVAVSESTQEQADATMRLVIDTGVNHIDVAPSYGIAEERVAPWVTSQRERFFVGDKTMERDRPGAEQAMRKSLETLGIPYFDLYQIHAIVTFDELDQVTRKGGALESINAGREAGLTRFIGITGHGLEIPAILIEALNRFDFDSVLFPINAVLYANPAYREKAQELLDLCRDRDVGTMIIKSTTKGPWGERPHTHITWYEPFTEAAQVQTAVNFALSQDVTGICMAGDPQVLPGILQACQNFTPLSAAEQEAQIAAASQYEPLFT